MGKQKEKYTKRAILYQLPILYIAQTNMVDGITARHTGNISIVNHQNDRFLSTDSETLVSHLGRRGCGPADRLGPPECSRRRAHRP
jgi:hypothetical protein